MYQSDECQLVSEADRRLHSSAAVTCVVPRSDQDSAGDWSFDVAGPWIWNKLPASTRLTEDLSSDC